MVDFHDTYIPGWGIKGCQMVRGGTISNPLGFSNHYVLVGLNTPFTGRSDTIHLHYHIVIPFLEPNFPLLHSVLQRVWGWIGSVDYSSLKPSWYSAMQKVILKTIAHPKIPIKVSSHWFPKKPGSSVEGGETSNKNHWTLQWEGFEAVGVPVLRSCRDSESVMLPLQETGPCPTRGKRKSHWLKNAERYGDILFSLKGISYLIIINQQLRTNIIPWLDSLKLTRAHH